MLQCWLVHVALPPLLLQLPMHWTLLPSPLALLRAAVCQTDLMLLEVHACTCCATAIAAAAAARAAAARAAAAAVQLSLCCYWACLLCCHSRLCLKWSSLHPW
jgi:hypothetical protein